MARSYNTASVCRFFDISKSTLFRWEREGTLGSVGRDQHNQRRYKLKDVGKVIYDNVLPRRYESVADKPEQARAVIEDMALTKLMSGDGSGLSELGELDSVSRETILRLVRLATEEYEPEEPAFAEILRVACLHSARLSGVDQR